MPHSIRVGLFILSCKCYSSYWEINCDNEKKSHAMDELLTLLCDMQRHQALSLSITGRVMLAQDRKRELLQGTVECVHSGEEEENVIICG